MKKYFVLAASFLALLPLKAYAMCPVCTVAIAGGVGLSRWLGVDDTVTGVWIGGLLVSMTFWTINYLNAKKIKFFGMNILIPIAYYLLTLIPLDYSEIIGHPYNKLWSIDKLILGIAIGTVITVIAMSLYELMRRKNGKAHFPFEKVALPVLSLILASGAFYFITR